MDVHDNNQIPLRYFAAFIIFCDKKDLGDGAGKMIPAAVRRGMREW
jgi:hypothetical protein